MGTPLGGTLGLPRGFFQGTLAGGRGARHPIIFWLGFRGAKKPARQRLGGGRGGSPGFRGAPFVGRGPWGPGFQNGRFQGGGRQPFRLLCRGGGHLPWALAGFFPKKFLPRGGHPRRAAESHTRSLFFVGRLPGIQRAGGHKPPSLGGWGEKPGGWSLGREGGIVRWGSGKRAGGRGAVTFLNRLLV